MRSGSHDTRRRQAGFTYVTVLLVVAILGLGLSATGQLSRTVALREREAELLYVGDQYRRAIARYYANGPSQYPRQLEDLLKDPRKPGIERYLRRLYDDPVTGSAKWGIVKAPDGGIMGVYSQSDGKPFKVSGFSFANQNFANATSYTEWKFIYAP
jgi:type II secretory pathway pseudopilin PulG